MRTLVLLLLIFLISTTNAIGCTCISKKETLKNKVTKEFVKSDIIFTGNVVAITDLNKHPTKSSSGDPIQYTFEIIEHLKGVDTKREIQVISARFGSSCGYEFQIGKTYMVYAIKSDHYSKSTGNEHDYSTSICSRNNYVARVTKKEKRILRKLSQKSR